MKERTCIFALFDDFLEEGTAVFSGLKDVEGICQVGAFDRLAKGICVKHNGVVQMRRVDWNVLCIMKIAGYNRINSF